MLKKTLFCILIFATSLLLANDTLDDFINEQIEVEAKFLDQNLSLDEKVLIKKEQEMAYHKFFFQYAANSKENLEAKNPYNTEINRLKLSARSNKYKGNTNAVMRDEVLLQSQNARNMIRKMLHETLQLASNTTRTQFKEKVKDVIIKYLSNYQPINENTYLNLEQNASSPIVASLLLAVKNHSSLDNVINTFSSTLTENSTNIYVTSRIAGSKYLSMVNAVNTTAYGLKVNSYLAAVNLNLAKIIIIFTIILIIFTVNRLLNFTINRILCHFKIKQEDIEYINARITKLLSVITSLMIIHIVILVFMDTTDSFINMNRVFGIGYIVLIATLLYRTTNVVAYIKMEQIKKSKILKNEVMNLTIKTISGLILLLALIAILKILGVNLTALLSGLGIAGAAVAFAAKDSIANFFGSVSILVGDVFEQGDWIETKDVNGTVVEIGLRASTIRTFDNALISIPNSELANFSVKNWSRRSIGRRIKMNIGVTYQSDFKNIRMAIVDIRTMLKEHPGIANQRTEYDNSYRQSKLVSLEDFNGVKRSTLVYMDEFTDSSINILIECFSLSVEREEWLNIKEDIMFKIAEILSKNNLDFAYPSLMLHYADKENKNASETTISQDNF